MTHKFTVNSEKKIYKCIPPEARGSYMGTIIEPEGYSEGDKPEWSCQLRWPKDDAASNTWVKEMGKLFMKVLIDKLGAKKAEALMKNPNLKIPLRDGDNEEREEYHGYWFMNVRNKFRQPVIVGPSGKAVPESMVTDDFIYSGAWYRAKLSFAYYDVKSKGIGAYIEILMKIRDDQRLDNVVDVGAAESEFAEFADPNAGFDGGDDDMFSDGSSKADTVAKPDDDDGFDFLK